MHVPPTSALSGYLAPGDVIRSVDDVPIQNAQDWVQVNTLTYNIKLNNVNISQNSGNFGTVNGRKGYCVPNLVMENSKFTELVENQYACSNDLTAFVKVSCSTYTLDDDLSKADVINLGRNFYCLDAKDVVKLKKCGDSWQSATPNGRSGCTCSMVQIYFLQPY